MLSQIRKHCNSKNIFLHVFNHIALDAWCIAAIVKLNYKEILYVVSHQTLKMKVFRKICVQFFIIINFVAIILFLLHKQRVHGNAMLLLWVFTTRHFQPTPSFFLLCINVCINYFIIHWNGINWSHLDNESFSTHQIKLVATHLQILYSYCANQKCDPTYLMIIKRIFFGLKYDGLKWRKFWIYPLILILT